MKNQYTTTVSRDIRSLNRRAFFFFGAMNDAGAQWCARLSGHESEGDQIEVRRQMDSTGNFARDYEISRAHVVKVERPVTGDVIITLADSNKMATQEA